MKRLLISIGLIVLLILMTSGCGKNKDEILKEEYVARYDTNIYKLEKYISEDFYLDNHLFFNHLLFNYNFKNDIYRESLDGLIKTLDETISNFDKLNTEIQDKKIQKYQSGIQSGLKDIKDNLQLYMKTEVVNAFVPNITTMYYETHKLMVEISEALIDINVNMSELDKYLEQYRNEENSPVNLQQLEEFKIKNKLRILYTCLYTTAYIASYDDYTGLHTNPKTPCYIELNDGVYVVYELNLDILNLVREFSKEYLDLEDIKNKIDDADVTIYCRLLDKAIEGMDNYYKIRSQFDSDFFTSYEFKKYQVKVLEKLGVVIYNFDKSIDTYNFSEMKNAYFQVKFLTDKSPLNSLMFPEKKVNLINNGAEEIIFENMD